MKRNTNNLKNNIEKNNIENMQKKIRDQAKRLCSMQEYINKLETTLKDNQNNNTLKNNYQSYEDLNKKYNDLQQKYNTLFINSQIYSSSSSITNEELNKDNLISKLKKENSELKRKLQNEIAKNQQQKNNIEFLKQNLETDIVKNGLRGCLNYLTEKLLNNDKDGEDAYLEILLDINKIKEENQNLIEENQNLINENQKLIEEKNKYIEKKLNFQKMDENLQKNMDIINKLNLENNNLYSKNELLQNELQQIKNNLNQNEKNLYELKEQNYLIIRENEILKNDNNNLIGLKNENNNLINTINELELKNNQLNNEIKSLKDYKLGYDLIKKENDEIKNLNQTLSYDNALFEQDVIFLKTNLDKLMDVGKNNILLKNELEDLRNLLNNLKNRKQVNNVFEKISELEQRNKDLESLLIQKEEKNKLNNKKYINDVINNYTYNHTNKNTYRRATNKINNENNKYILANQYYADLLLRVLKYHIKDNINVKNILFQLLDLNHKKIVLISDIDNLNKICDNKTKNINKNNKKDDINKKKIELKNKEKELETLLSTITYFDKELMQYEPK